MEAKVISVSPITTSAAGWSVCKVELDNGTKGEVFLGKNITDTDVKVGITLTYEQEESQYGLKLKVKNLKNGKFSSPSPRPFGAPKDSTGIAVGAAMNNAVLLAAHGVIKIDDIEKYTRRIIEVSAQLKKEFEGRV